MCVCVYACARELTISSQGAPDPHSRECLLIGQFPPHDNTPADRQTDIATIIIRQLKENSETGLMK